MSQIEIDTREKVADWVICPGCDGTGISNKSPNKTEICASCENGYVLVYR